MKGTKTNDIAAPISGDDQVAADTRWRKKRRWGPWTIDPRDACLVYQRAGVQYFVAIDEMTDSAQILDWIFQVSEKSWASRGDVGHLVEAIEEMLGRDVAAGGIDHPIDPVEILAARYGVSPA